MYTALQRAAENVKLLLYLKQITEKLLTFGLILRIIIYIEAVYSYVLFVLCAEKEKGLAVLTAAGLFESSTEKDAFWNHLNIKLLAQN